MAILLGGSGGEASHGELLAGLRRGARLLLVEPGPVTWQRGLVEAAVEVPAGDGEAAVDAALRLASAHPVTAVLCYLEPLLALPATIAERAGVRGMSSRVAATVRDKPLQREALRSAPLRSTRSALVADLNAARAAADAIGYPVVIKPRNFSGGLGVQIATGPKGFADACRATLATAPREAIARAPGALVEELLAGPQFSVNCWALDGRAEPLSLSRAWDTGSAGAHRRLGDGSGRRRSRLAARIEEAACQAALACGLDGTIADVELILTDGEPRVLEVNGRPAGDQAVRMAALASGVDLGRALADVAVGRRPRPAPPPRRAVGIVFLFPPEPMLFGGLRIPDELREAGWLDRCHATAMVGSRVTPPFGSDVPHGPVRCRGSQTRRWYPSLTTVWTSFRPSTPLPEPGRASSGHGIWNAFASRGSERLHAEPNTPAADEDQACALTLAALLFSTAKREQATALPVDEFVATAARLVDQRLTTPG